MNGTVVQAGIHDGGDDSDAVPSRDNADAAQPSRSTASRTPSRLTGSASSACIATAGPRRRRQRHRHRAAAEGRQLDRHQPDSRHHHRQPGRADRSGDRSARSSCGSRCGRCAGSPTPPPASPSCPSTAARSRSASGCPSEDTDTRTEVGQVGAALNSLLGHVATALDRPPGAARCGSASSSPTPATSCARRWPSIRGYAELTRRTGDDLPDDIQYAMDRVESEATRMTGPGRGPAAARPARRGTTGRAGAGRPHRARDRRGERRSRRRTRPPGHACVLPGRADRGARRSAPGCIRCSPTC